MHDESVAGRSELYAFVSEVLTVLEEVLRKTKLV